MSDLIPRLDSFFGAWAILPQALSDAAAALNGRELGDHAAITALVLGMRRKRDEPVRRIGPASDVALIELSGPLMKHQSSLGGTSTIDARRQVREATAAERIRAILLAIESPGGTIAGTAELADEVSKAATIKPVHAFIEDLGASAAYWVASQASWITVNASGLVGSIGSYAGSKIPRNSPAGSVSRFTSSKPASSRAPASRGPK